MIKRVLDKYLKTVWKDPERKPFGQIVGEAVRFSVRKKTLPTAYFTRLLYKKRNTRYLDYTSNPTVTFLQKHYNDPSFVPVLENKYLYHLFFKEQGITIPNSIAYNIGNIFFVGSERLIVEDTEMFRKLLYRIIGRCKKNNVLFMKEVAGAWGKGAHKISADDLEKKNFDTESLFRDIVSASFIIQEAIVQHEEINRLYPLSINSIRMDTFMDREGNVEILSALLRMGGNGNFVDNVTAGGLFVPIDLESGKLGKRAQTFLKNGAKSHEAHPYTGTPFEGFAVPFFDEAKQLVKKAAEKIPALRLVGWDVVITPEGPLLLEGNHLYHIGMSEMAYGGYLKHPVFRKALHEAGLSADEEKKEK
ncbi:sugar-transfer associated ATP-grasp domain-containing protein [Hydrogenimonas sp. SS33]|uniref:sugar-transfer associated ATP-grasp domain-containing protein n=1 Tax=Hydrogenimonas leucolamina TaxID=2954236 RepID=UPI00336C153C